jgi:hypothetical protein
MFDPGDVLDRYPAMSWNECEILAARRIIVDAATAMLAGKLSYIEGSRKVAVARFAARLDGDADVLPFVGICSETEALPFGELREHWQAAALDALKPRIEESEAWAQGFGERHCHNLLKRFRTADHA